MLLSECYYQVPRRSPSQAIHLRTKGLCIVSLKPVDHDFRLGLVERRRLPAAIFLGFISHRSRDFLLISN